YDSWLSWGSGICGSQSMYDYQTAGGSNLLTLTSTGYKDYTACEHTFAAASCIAPETCTKCGYERGYETGHSFVCTNEVLPSGEAAGSVVATCSVCGEVKNLTLQNDGTAPYYTFYSTDATISEQFSSGWTANWYDIVDDSEVEGRQGNMLYYKDASGNLKAKTAFDTSTFGYSVADCATRGDGLFYADGNLATIADDVDMTHQTGTYFDCSSFPASAFTYKLDVYPTDYTFKGKDKYVKGLYNWFGKKAADYMAGLFVFNSETDNPIYLFAIASTDLCQSLYDDVETFKARCEAYKEVDYSVVAANEWHEHVFLYDDNAQYASLYWDGELMVSAHNPQFKYINGGSMNAIYRRMNIPFYAKDIVVGRTAVASQFVGGTTPATTYKATINGVEYDYEAGATVTVTASNGAFYLDGGRGLRFAGWTGDVEFADSASTETTFVMPANDVTVTESYFIVGDLNNDGKVNVTDANIIKKMITGSAAQIGAADINNDTKINAQDANNLKAMVLGKFTPSK
ncbi:MAG: dockerin type I domain-containing protein, partial [Clostridia bacterium]|nr:dockerin type I domain-containing protein [Clostridia bacterium]